MNGFKLMADGYKRILLELENDGDLEDIEEIKAKIKVNEFLSTCSEKERLEIYNSGAFNEITKIYVRKAMSNLEYQDKQILQVINEIKWLHDTIPVSEIVQ